MRHLPEPYGEPGAHAPDGEPNCLTDVHCTVCRQLLTPALGHEHTPLVIPPTCTEQGYTLHTCNRCDDSYTDTFVDALGHTEGTAATCTDDQVCTVCGTVLTERLGHEYAASVTLSPTCTDTGILTHTCSRCADTYDEVIPANGHTAGTVATCTEDQTCTVCHVILTPRLGHDYHATIVDPTCTEQGYIRHTCSRCDLTYLDSYSPANGHIEGAAATCTEDQTCTVCHVILTPRLGHDYHATIVDPTCTEQGYIRHTCSRCDLTYLDSYSPAKGHIEGEAATCTEYQTCTVCHAILAERLEHDYAETVIEATCTEDGLIVHTCTGCNRSYIRQILPATGHTPGDWVIDNQPDVGIPGRKHQACAECSAVLEAETFWAPTEDTTDAPADPTETSASNVASDATSYDNGNDTKGCINAINYVFIIVIVLAAAFFFWFIDARRRS